jgi:Polyketide cyclase / dehydrase and lipid transport
MLKTLGIIVLVIAALLAGVMIYATTKPDSFGVMRSTTVKAPPDRIFALINDFQQWRTWSPYENKDPAMKRTFGAVTAGPGATYAWDGNNEVGQGDMAITATTAPTLVTIKLHFIKPFEGTNQVDFRLEPQGDATRVTWDMKGPAPFVTKLMSTFFDMDKMIGKDFEVGLANLKALAEQR